MLSPLVPRKAAAPPLRHSSMGTEAVDANDTASGNFDICHFGGSTNAAFHGILTAAAAPAAL
eukprot:2290110-Pleurochrysis_carterae.AAC.1